MTYQIWLESYYISQKLYIFFFFFYQTSSLSKKFPRGKRTQIPIRPLLTLCSKPKHLPERTTVGFPRAVIAAVRLICGVNQWPRTVVSKPFEKVLTLKGLAVHCCSVDKQRRTKWERKKDRRRRKCVSFSKCYKTKVQAKLKKPNCE